MADIAPLTSGSIPNFGLMQQQQAAAGASANLMQQQAQGAQIANQQAALQLQLYRQGVAHVLDFSGQNGGQPRTLPDLNSQSDVSGTQPSGTQPTGAQPTGQAGGDANSQSDVSGTQPGGTQTSGTVTPFENIGQSAADQGRIQALLEQHYNVDPAGTPQEQLAIHQAYAQAAQMKLSGNPGLIAWADQNIETAKANRDMNVKSRVNASQLDASKSYDLANSIESAPDGQALSMLAKSGPGGAAAARRLTEMNPDATPEELDEITRDTVAHTAAFTQRFTGRETEVGTDGIRRDKVSGLPVTGIPPTGVSQQQLTDMYKDGNSTVTVTRNGQETQVPKYQAAGYQNVDQFVQAGVAQARSVQLQQNMHMALAAHMTTQAQQRTAAAGGAPQAGAPQAGAPQAQAGAVQPQGASGVVPGVQPGAAAARPDPLVSPNAKSTGGRLDFSDAPAAPLPNLQGSNAKPRPDQTAIMEGYGKDVAASAATASQKVSQANQTIQLANNAQIALKSGAMTGSAAQQATYVMNLVGNPVMLQGILGNAAASDALRKMLGNESFAQIEADAQGNQMRLGAQTIKTAMTQLSASPDMTPAAIIAITNSVKMNAQYDKKKWGQDYATYIRTAGPNTDKRADAYSGYYDSKYAPTSTLDPNTLNGGGGAGGAGGAGGMPDAGANRGRSITLASGQKLQSNGTQWLPVGARRGGAGGSF